MKNAGKACNNRLYRHIRTFEKIIKNYFVIYKKSVNHKRGNIEKEKNKLTRQTKLNYNDPKSVD